MNNKYRGKIDCTADKLSEILEEYRDCGTACPIDEKGWVYGSLINGDKPYIVGEVRESIPYGGIILDYWYPVKKDTVGQYTGKKDMRANEIYDGDIVVCGVIPELEVEKRLIGVVDYDKSAYFISFINREPGLIKRFGFCSFINYEIIGNIHDNPELSEVEE